MKQLLGPTLEDLRMECVLMQAWKKASSYIRYHSWYSDTLSIDYQALRIPHFLTEIQERLADPLSWVSQPLEMVPAPKTQNWCFDKSREWVPANGVKVHAKLRPLAHVGLADQVVTTAIMLCLADRVETSLGNPKASYDEPESRAANIAYGHRLFCDRHKSTLRHRWGSSKLYRQYYQDYQTFLERPRVVASTLISSNADYEIAIVSSDLSKFYDRVRPILLSHGLRQFQQSDSEEEFFSFAERVLDWRWARPKRAQQYAELHKITGFNSIALPQGLAASGFFANVALCRLDSILKETIGKDLRVDESREFVLEDVCYYVDDFRLVIRVPSGIDESEVRQLAARWLQTQLDRYTPGLKIEESKTHVVIEGREQKFLVQQSKTARRIQSEASGTFDTLHGTELIGAIEGFFHTQKRYSTVDELGDGRTGLLVGMSDMRDETAARFAAGRFRRTFRSLRPLLAFSDESGSFQSGEDEDSEGAPPLPDSLVLSKQQLDERAKLFAALLIEEWTSNPGNIRLLRIAVDMYPDAEFLERVLELLRPGWKTGKSKGPRREVKLYCLAELFRAGATETALVREDDCLPDDISAEKYHDTLTREAVALFEDYIARPRPSSRHPWYLIQQVMLYLAARNAFPKATLSISATGGELLAHYKRFAKFLSGDIPVSLEERSIFVCLAYTGFGIPDLGLMTQGRQLSEDFLARVNDIAPTVAEDLWKARGSEARQNVVTAAQRLGIEPRPPEPGRTTVAELATQGLNPFYLEENLLRLASWILELDEDEFATAITPWQIFCRCTKERPGDFGSVDSDSFELSRTYKTASHLFVATDWCQTTEEKRKFQTGLLLRYAIRGTTGFDGNHRARASRNPFRYAKPVAHWEQQRYSSFQGRSAFGPSWIPLSSFTEGLLFELLRWPGAGITSLPESIETLRKRVSDRLEKLRKSRGQLTSEVFLEQRAGLPYAPLSSEWTRPLRIGVVQSVTPCLDDYVKYSTDPELLADHDFKVQRRAHLSAMLEGVAQMLRVRQTHKRQDRRDSVFIDLLVFPELAIHPDDVDHFLIPFVRKHKCMFLGGLVYHREKELVGSPLINSCLWLIPEWTTSAGFQIRRIEQGKKHLTVSERKLTPAPVPFRPAQWLIEYAWADPSMQSRPLRLSASVCYDATDLGLAADLRSCNDLYMVCALNRDVGTFDRMSEGLHYHMFQGVIVVNNGQFGGSSFFVPHKDQYRRQVFHLHGQPQASIAFAEIEPQKLIERPNGAPELDPVGEWKTHPAGYNPVPTDEGQS